MMIRWAYEKMRLQRVTPAGVLVFWALSLLQPDAALATQGHGGIEGVYAHQIAHVFFLISMGVLIYWLRQRGLVRESGWRFIQYAAFFLILWNIDTILVHALDDQFGIISTERIGSWNIKISHLGGDATLTLVYYLAKLDHLLCVPAIVCLYIGLRRLLQVEPDRPARRQLS